MGSMQALNVLFVLAHERLLHVNTEHIHHQSSAFLLLFGREGDSGVPSE